MAHKGKRSIWRTTAILGILAVLVAGCSIGGNAAPTTPAPAASGTGEAKTETGNTGDSTATGDDQTDEATSAFLSAEKITLTVFAAALPELKITDFAYEQNAFTKWLEDTTNIHLDWEIAPTADDVTTKLSLLISSGKVPDIMLINNFSPSVQQTYGAQGLLLKLNDYIEKYGVWTKAMFEENPDTRTAVTLNEGNIYALPTYSGDSTFLKSFYKMWVYQPWLDALQMSAPQTTEQFYEMLVAFRDRDPNGNGKKDEIPLLGNTSWVAWNPVPYLMNAFLYYDPDTKMIVNNGRVEPAFTQPAFKEGLKFLHRLAAEGLMSKESFTMDYNQFKQAVENPDAPLVGLMPSHAPFVAAETRHPDYVALPPLRGPAGVQYAHYNYVTGSEGAVISALSKHPVEAFKLLDFLYSPEASMRKVYGRKGMEWDAAADGDGADKNGNKAAYKFLQTGNAYDSNEGELNTNWGLIGNSYLPERLQNSFVATENPEAELLQPLIDATLDLYVPHLPQSSMLLPQTIVFSDEQSAQFTDLGKAIHDYVNETMMAVILGSQDIDAIWETYLATLDKLGLNRLLAMYQTYLDELQ